MQRLALDLATDALNNADTYLDELAKAETFPNARRAWANFLIHSHLVYNLFEAGRDPANTKSTDLINNLKNSRKTDPLLTYLYVARDQFSHSLRGSGRSEVGAIGEIPDITTSGACTAVLAVRISVEGVLHPVENRKGTTIPVPTKHQGELLIDVRPTEAGKLAIRFLRGRVSTAEKILVMSSH